MPNSILRVQAVAWNRGDIDTFMEPYWRSEKLTFSSGGAVTRGWQPTLDRYRLRYPDAQTRGQLSFEIDEVRRLDDRAALVLGRWRLRRDAPIAGNFSLVFRWTDGDWKIVHDHTSVTPRD